MANQIVLYCGHCGNKTTFETRGRCVLDRSIETEYEEGEWKGKKESVYDDTAQWELLQCVTCSNVSLLYTHDTADYINTWMDENDNDIVPQTHEEKILYPSTHTNLPNLPPTIEKEYQEALKVRNISPVACAVLARRTLEAVFTCENAQGNTLIQKVDNLIKSDRFPPLFAEMAHLARKIGNLGAHFADIAITEQDTEAMLDFLEAILEYLYVVPAKVEAVRKRLSELP